MYRKCQTSGEIAIYVELSDLYGHKSAMPFIVYDGAVAWEHFITMTS